MAVLFSAVTLTDIAKGKQAEFLVAGIPRDYQDLEGWTAFEEFMQDIDEDTDISVHAEAYLYGESEIFKATPEEVAYMYKRMEGNPNFLADRCQNKDKVDFDFNWSPDELFRMEMS